MGLPPRSQVDIENLNKRVSDDVLSIELDGPEHQHLSVVDVPGLFHSKLMRNLKVKDMLIFKTQPLLRPSRITLPFESSSGPT